MALVFTPFFGVSHRTATDFPLLKPAAEDKASAQRDKMLILHTPAAPCISGCLEPEEVTAADRKNSVLKEANGFKL